MNTTVKILAACAAAAALNGACHKTPVGDGKAEQELERERVPVARESVSTRSALAFNDAIGAIVDARCSQQTRCDNVGGGKQYPSEAACKQAVRSGFSDDVVPAECPDAVDRRALAACVKAVRDEGCGAALDTLSRIAQCRTAALCPHAP